MLCRSFKAWRIGFLKSLFAKSFHVFSQFSKKSILPNQIHYFAAEKYSKTRKWIFLRKICKFHCNKNIFRAARANSLRKKPSARHQNLDFLSKNKSIFSRSPFSQHVAGEVGGVALSACCDPACCSFPSPVDPLRRPLRPKLRKITCRVTCVAREKLDGDACRDLAEFLNTFAAIQIRSAANAELFGLRSRQRAGSTHSAALLQLHNACPVWHSLGIRPRGNFSLRLGFLVR